MGELAEIFQWRGEVARGLPEFKEKDKNHVGEEMSDVLLYLVSPVFFFLRLTKQYMIALSSERLALHSEMSLFSVGTTFDV